MDQKLHSLIFSAKQISINFGDINVLRNINLNLFSGKAVGIVGENGAGKSTLMKILTGFYKPTSGGLYYKGDFINIANIYEAKNKYKIAIVHQEQQLCLELTVAENIFLGSEIRNKIGGLSSKIINKKSQKILNELGVDFSSKALLKNLTISQRQFVEIAKSLIQNPEIIIFDEATSVLTQKDTEKLYQIVKNLKKQNIAIVWITHRMEEISKICEEILIIKDGKFIVQKPFNKFKNINEIVNLMVGRKLEDRYPAKFDQKLNFQKNFEIKHLNSIHHRNINLKIYGGEIVVIYGLVGAGRTEMAKIIFGTINYTTGTFILNNHNYLPKNPNKAIANKIFYLCEDRKLLGLNINQSINFNINIASLSKAKSFLGFILYSKEKKYSQKFVNLLNIKTHSINQLINNLSGGNQQKVAISKGLNTEAELFILDEPTRGVDVGARKDIYEIISKLKKQQKMLLIISSDLPEVLGIADRVIIFCEGSITANLTGSDINENTIIKHALNINYDSKH